MILIWVIIAAGALWAWPYLWFQAVNRFVDVDIQIDRALVEVGDTIQLSCTITNRSWLPLPNLRLFIPLPEGLAATGTDNQHYLRLRTRMSARESITCSAACRAVARGPQSFQSSPAEVMLSEGFGLQHLVIQRHIQHELAVLPQLLTREFGKLQLRSILGDAEVQRWLHPDESLYKGLRPYQTGDPFKHIAWLASATSGSWQVKQFSTSSDATLHLVLNAQLQADYWTGVNRETFDALCSTVATVALMLAKRGYQLHFWTNAIWPRDGRKLDFGRQSAIGIRSLLAELRPLTTVPLSSLLTTLCRRPNRQEEILLFTSYLSETDVQFIQTRRGEVNLTIVPGPGADLAQASSILQVVSS